MNPTSNRYLCVPSTSQRAGSLPAAAGLLEKVSERFRVSPRQTVSALLAIALVLALPILAGAQTSAALPRITGRVDDTTLTPLHGNVHPLARAQYDQGAVADSQPMHRMLLLLQRSPAQETALRQLMDNQQSSASANYHQWLTPQQFGQQFGPADADVQTVTDWLTSHGFQVAKVSAGKTVIEFSGNAGQVRTAFHTEIHRYVVNGEEHLANNTDPQIPTALVPVVAGPVSLHNFPKHALIKKLGAFRKNAATGKVDPLYTYTPNPNYCGSTPCNALGPGDFDTIYNVEKLWNPGIGGHVIDGTGQTIAIVGDSEICTANSPDFGTSYIGPFGTTVTCSSDDVATFRTLFGLPANPPNVILDGPDPGFNGDETEGDLDVEWSASVAKGATIDFVIAEGTEATSGTDLAAEYIVDNNLAPVLSESFGECEFYLGYGGNEFEALLWEQAATQGITVVVSAGDSGSATCDDGFNVAEFGLAVNGIASTPFNVAAGGTDFDITPSGYQTTYWSANNITDANGLKGVSATKYIPETTWNDSCAQNLTAGTITGSGGCTAQNYSGGGIVAGGGGQSNSLFDSSGNCCYFYGKPSWQTLPENGAGLTGLAGTNPDAARDLPDISLFAADGYISDSFYVVCEADFNSPPAACNLSADNFFDFVGVGGTSSSAPTFAGMMALVNQEMTIQNGINPKYPTSQGNANYVLYPLFSNQSGSCNSTTGPASGCTFNDITRGNNSVPCTPVYSSAQQDETYGCSTTVQNAYGVLEAQNLINGGPVNDLYGFDAAAGPDLATGLGSINALNLVSNWPGVVGNFTPTATTLCLSTMAIPTTTTSCSTPITITHGTPVYVNIAVDQTVGGVTSPIPVTENFTVAPPSTTAIAEDVALIGTFTAGNPCTIPGCNTTGAVDHFTSNNYQVSNWDFYPLTNGVFTSATASTTANQNFTTFLTGGSYNVIARYGGDGTFGASNSTTPISVTVSPEGSSATVTVESYSPSGTLISSPVPYGDFNYVRVDVIGASSGQENATGLVTLTDNGVAAVNSTGGTTLNYSLNTEGYLEDQTAFLAVGPHSFVAKYGGDASYNVSAASAAVALTVIPASVTTAVAANPTTVSSGASVTLTATVSTLSQGIAPTGTVQFLVGGVPFGAPVAVTGSPNANTGFVQAVATKVTTTLPSGQDSITAQYSGDANYLAGSASAAITESVGSAGINLLPVTGTVTINVTQLGQSATQLITATGTAGFAGTVTLSAAVTATPSGAVDSPTCTFGTPDTNFTAPGTLTLSATSETGTATMSCTTTAASVIVFRPSSRPSGSAWPLAGVAISLVCLFFLLAIPKQQRWRLVPLAVLFVVVAAAGVSCSGGSSSGGGGGGVTNPGTTLGNYTVTVTATPSTGTAEMITITVDVQ